MFFIKTDRAVNQQKPVIQSPIYRVLQAAEYLNISASTMRRLLEAGSIPKIRLSKSAFGVLRSDLDAYIQKSRTAAPVPPDADIQSADVGAQIPSNAQ
jgi:excisionase family DNA binding protein